MRCKHCNSHLAAHDLWCALCGHQSPVVNQELSATASLKETWSKYKVTKGTNVPAATFVLVLGLVPISLIVFLMSSFGYMELHVVKDIGTLLLRLFIISGSISLLVPILLIAFQPIAETVGYHLHFRSIISGFKAYPRYLVFSLLCAMYYVIIYLICFGLPSFGSDPILRLVWIVLVNYFVAIVMPVPMLMERNKINAWKAFKISYKNFHVIRWQMYLMALVLGLLNVLAIMLLVIPLLITMPYSWFAIRDYTNKLLDFEIIRDSK